jgi:hypothetical protein
MLEGCSPAVVIRVTLYLALFQVALLLVGAVLLVLFKDLPLKLEDAAVFLVAVVVRAPWSGRR